MESLNYRQLSERFPLNNNCMSSSEAWAHMLKDWRDKGILKEKQHWKYGPSVEGNNQPTRYYDLLKIVKLVVIEHQKADRPRPRIQYLCQQYTEEFAIILKSDATAASVNK